MAAKKSIDDPGFIVLWNRLGARGQLSERLADIGERRIADMDSSGIDLQILSLTSPGVQVFDADTATGLAASTNDQVAEAVRKYPTRFAALGAVAPQDPKRAAVEAERAVRKLGLKGIIINSHTKGEFLDDPKFWDIFEAAEALNVPIYIHPQAPPPAMSAPYVEKGLEGALWGFAAETGLHLLAILRSGALDRFPRLRIVVGHAGEALPFWLYRLDYMNRSARPFIRNGTDRLQRTLSEYIRRERVRDHQRHAVGTGHYLRAVGARDGSRDVRDGLSVSVRARRGDGHRRRADQRRRQNEVVPDQRGARLRFVA